MRSVYYLITGLRDAKRARGALLANVLIVAGICLPIFLLLGLRRGLVAQFRADIQKSPTAREVEAHVSTAGSEMRFTLSSEDGLAKDVPGISMVIPRITANAWVANEQGDELEITLSCTKPGDPFLAFYGADVLDEGDRGAVISRAVADALRIEYRPTKDKRYKLVRPAKLKVRIVRGGDYALDPLTGSNPLKKYELDVPVRHVFATTDTSAKSVFLNRQIMDWLEDFKKGRSVPELNLLGFADSLKAEYDGYLAFTKVDEPYREQEIQQLRNRGLTAISLEDFARPDAPLMRRLYGLLTPHDLHVYWLYAGHLTGSGRATVSIPPSEVEEITRDCDDRVFPWTEPCILAVNGQSHRIIGISGSARWLKKYFRNANLRFSESDKPDMQIILASCESGALQTAANQDHARLPDHGKTELARKENSVRDVATPMEKHPSGVPANNGGSDGQDALLPSGLESPPLASQLDASLRGTGSEPTEADARLLPAPNWLRRSFDFLRRIPVETGTALNALDRLCRRPPFSSPTAPPPVVDPGTVQILLPTGEEASLTVKPLEQTEERVQQAVLGPQFTRLVVDLEQSLPPPHADQGGGEQRMTVEFGQHLGLDFLRILVDIVDGAMYGPPGPPLAVVPAPLVAHMARAEEGKLDYDSVMNRYVPAAVENAYPVARIYTDDLDSVPSVDDRLRSMGYGTISSRTRVEEMQGYVRTLDVLIFVVLNAVLIFGIITVLSVFWDVTFRKRGAIGIMRLMGMPAEAIFLIVLVRALVVGGLGAATTLIVGPGIAWLLTRFVNADCQIQTSDVLWVLAGAFGCCFLGVAAPAIYAARKLEPVDAIVGSRVQ